MNTFALLFGITGLVGGTVVVYVAIARLRVAGDAIDYLAELDAADAPTDEFQRRLSESFIRRVVKPLGTGVFRHVAGFTPSHYLDSIHKRLLVAGLASSIRAEEFLTAQVLSTGLGLVLSVAWAAFGHPPQRYGVLALVMLPLIGAIAPNAWLSRKVTERKDSIRKELPDVLDLLAISVEAGVGFEGAMQVVTEHFVSPLAEEMSRTLQEMQLGLPRREALQNLKRRTEVPELSNFVLALVQADALGMPIGRVLKTQASEMRVKRRQWAREKAGKLPVKILFPLVIFIFPAVLVIILGPAGASIAKSL
jgi:tight adherence protein C